MKKIAKISMLAIGAAMVTQALHAQYNDGDLLIGFASSGNDYVIDLGQIPTLANTQLGGAIDLNLYNTTFGSSAVSVGVIAGDNSGTFDPAGKKTIWTTTLRAGLPATAFVTAGTESAPANISKTQINNLAPIPGSLQQGVTGVTSGGLIDAWSETVAQSSTQNGSVIGNWGAAAGNPMASLASQPITLDLWTTSADVTVNHYTYVGDIQIDMTGASASVIFDPAAVPEPATYALLGGGGLLAFVLRRNTKKQNV